MGSLMRVANLVTPPRHVRFAADPSREKLRGPRPRLRFCLTTASSTRTLDQVGCVPRVTVVAADLPSRT